MKNNVTQVQVYIRHYGNREERQVVNQVFKIMEKGTCYKPRLVQMLGEQREK